MDITSLVLELQKAQDDYGRRLAALSDPELGVYKAALQRLRASAQALLDENHALLPGEFKSECLEGATLNSLRRELLRVYEEMEQRGFVRAPKSSPDPE